MKIKKYLQQVLNFVLVFVLSFTTTFAFTNNELLYEVIEIDGIQYVITQSIENDGKIVTIVYSKETNEYSRTTRIGDILYYEESLNGEIPNESIFTNNNVKVIDLNNLEDVSTI